ncbi:hypothetical protein ACFQY4_46110 [Catellatospora bangladeshensis]|uniref:Uncharacterized protein n=1 Tax=Catellatospora bangladeshensis TaxID=310355 RepID=A0A8J3JTA0_9ACTN|nr:hypothetical protein [Catellatospora bangladeshensis]GIF86497.1 hypothetical protein Cba03nite_78460 [Catellatospora bangladeshensis]
MTAPASAYPVSVAALVDDFRAWADELGATPSHRATMKRFSIGGDKARALLATLPAPAPDEHTTAVPAMAKPAPAPPAQPAAEVAPDAPDVLIMPAALSQTAVDVEAPTKIAPAAPEPIPVVAPGEVSPVLAAAARLDDERARLNIARHDELARRAAEAEHRIALGDVREQARAAKLARRERARDTADAAALAALYRRAARSGTRARLRAQIQGSAEMRALRVARVRQVTLLAGVPVLAAFAAWSTTGVQAGVARLLGLGADTAGWWAAWAMEPALIAIVGLIIIGRAVLRSAGGDTDWRATAIEWTTLGTSLLLNIVGGWTVGVDWFEQVGPMLAHSVGPIGAAGTAFLIGLFDGYVSAARPWRGAPSLAEMNLDLSAVTSR